MEGLEKYADVEIVKSLRGAGFSDQYILGMIESGGIDIEKAMACDKKEVMKETKKEEEIEKGKKLEKSDEPEKVIVRVIFQRKRTGSQRCKDISSGIPIKIISIRLIFFPLSKSEKIGINLLISSEGKNVHRSITSSS